MAYLLDRASSRQPMINAPPVVLWLIAVLVVCHIVRVALPDGWPDAVVEQFGLVPARFGFVASLPAVEIAVTAASLFTYMFLHANYTHVGVNCLWLLVFGPVVARTLGAARFLLFFMICGLAAVLLHVAFNWDSRVSVIGASGAISGLMAAGIRLLYGHLYHRRDGLAPVFCRPVVMFSLVWTAINIVSGVFRIGVDDDVSLVAWIAHLAGFFTGLFLISTFVGARGSRSREPGATTSPHSY